MCPAKIASAEEAIERLGGDAATVKARKGPEGGFPGMTVMGAYCEKRTDAADALRAALVACAESYGEAQVVGSIMGLDVTATFQAGTGCFRVGVGHAPAMTFEGADSGIGAVTRIEREARNMERYAASAAERLERAQAELAAAREGVGKPFPQQRRLLEVKQRLAELDAKIGDEGTRSLPGRRGGGERDRRRPALARGLRARAVRPGGADHGLTGG